MTSNNNELEILLVEDNPYDAEMTIGALLKNNLANKIVHVKDGEEALDYLLSGKFLDENTGKVKQMIVLLDLKLPKVDGLEVLKEIKSNPETKIIPVIILTTSNEESDLIRSYDLGVNSYIVKPVDFKKFVEVVKHLGLYWILYNQHPKNNH